MGSKRGRDTIDWLVKNVPQSNGEVGMFGTSTDGSAVVMALLDPHPTGLREGDSYLSDPSKRVPYWPRPLQVSDDDS